MATLVPENLARLQIKAFVKDAELMAIGRGEAIYCAAEKMAHSTLRKILHDFIKTEGDYMGYRGQTLSLDVYVITPEELHKMLVKARTEGERGAKV